MVERALNSLKFANAKIIGFIMNDVEDNKYIYGGYKVNGGYRYGNKKIRYVRYGYFSADNAQNALGKSSKPAEEKKEEKKEEEPKK